MPDWLEFVLFLAGYFVLLRRVLPRLRRANLNREAMLCRVSKGTESADGVPAMADVSRREPS